MSSAKTRLDAAWGWPAAVAVITALAYLARPSFFYNFDGVACAIAVDLGELSRLVHGNHLGYGLLGLVFDRAWRLLGYAGPAILPLQVLDSLLGALGAGLFCRLLLRRAACSPLTAVAASAGLAFSYAYWFWSLEAQVYMLGTVLVLAAADEALAPSPRPWLVALWQAGAILGHVGHLMFVPAGVYLLWTGSRRGKAALRSYLLVLGGAVFLSYAAAGLLFVQPRDLSELRLWLLGSAALKVGGEFTWYTGSISENLRDWSLMTLRVFSDALALSGGAQAFSWLLGLAAVAAAAAGAAGRARPARAALLWLAAYALLFGSWQPFTIVYRVSDLVPLWLLIALAARGSRARSAALAGAAAALALFNAAQLIRPQTDPLRNAAYQEALWLGQAAPEDAWIAVSGMGQVYVPYFAGRRPLNMRYFEEPGRLEAKLDALDARGEAVFAPSSLLASDPRWRARFEAYGLVEAARTGESVLYRVKAAARKGSRGAGAGRD